MRISDWSSDVCSSDLERAAASPVPIHTALPPQAPSRQTAPSPTLGRGIRRERGRAPSAHEEVLGAVGFDRLGEAAEGVDVGCGAHGDVIRSEEHTSELQSLIRTSYAVFCFKKKERFSSID